MQDNTYANNSRMNTNRTPPQNETTSRRDDFEVSPPLSRAELDIIAICSDPNVLLADVALNTTTNNNDNDNNDNNNNQRGEFAHRQSSLNPDSYSSLPQKAPTNFPELADTYTIVSHSATQNTQSVFHGRHKPTKFNSPISLPSRNRIGENVSKPLTQLLTTQPSTQPSAQLSTQPLEAAGLVKSPSEREVKSKLLMPKTLLRPLNVDLSMEFGANAEGVSVPSGHLHSNRNAHARPHKLLPAQLTHPGVHTIGGNSGSEEKSSAYGESAHGEMAKSIGPLRIDKGGRLVSVVATGPPAPWLPNRTHPLPAPPLCLSSLAKFSSDKNENAKYFSEFALALSPKGGGVSDFAFATSTRTNHDDRLLADSARQRILPQVSGPVSGHAVDNMSAADPGEESFVGLLQPLPAFYVSVANPKAQDLGRSQRLRSQAVSPPPRPPYSHRVRRSSPQHSPCQKSPQRSSPTTVPVSNADNPTSTTTNRTTITTNTNTTNTNTNNNANDTNDDTRAISLNSKTFHSISSPRTSPRHPQLNAAAATGADRDKILDADATARRVT
jgi:hypothetical protein